MVIGEDRVALLPSRVSAGSRARPRRISSASGPARSTCSPRWSRLCVCDRDRRRPPPPTTARADLACRRDEPGSTARRHVDGGYDGRAVDGRGLRRSRRLIDVFRRPVGAAAHRLFGDEIEGSGPSPRSRATLHPVDGAFIYPAAERAPISSSRNCSTTGSFRRLPPTWSRSCERARFRLQPVRCARFGRKSSARSSRFEGVAELDPLPSASPSHSRRSDLRSPPAAWPRLRTSFAPSFARDSASS